MNYRDVIGMKQRITHKDLEQLSAEQRQKLSAMWLPERYDAAVAYVCKDVASEEYDEIEFLVGSLGISHGHYIYLTDLRAIYSSGPDNAESECIDSNPDTTSASNASNSDYELARPDPVFGTDSMSLLDATHIAKAIDNIQTPLNDSEDYEDESFEDEPEADFNEEDLECNYERPSIFSKSDCAPLLTIGQMIDILQKNNFGYSDFYLYASTGQTGCELGKDIAGGSGYRDYEAGELCNVLWESVKAMLE